MKKVGIITYHYAYNFGAMMQAYALKKTVEDLTEYEVELIKYKPAKYKLGAEEYRNKKYIGQKNKMNDFKKKYHGILSPETDKIEKIPEYDYYITGSDQVWNPELPIPEKTSEYFLDFVSNDKVKIAYAASVGQKVEKEDEIEVFREHIPRFDFLSVREQSVCPFIETFTNKKCHAVFDPTLLLDGKDYEYLLPKKENCDDHILCVLYSKNYAPKTYDKVNRYAIKKNCNVIHMEKNISPYLFLKPEESLYYAGIDEMLWAVKNAKVVITDSFHFMVFAILFHKPLWVLENGKRASRQTDLLSYLQLEDRIYRDNLTIEELEQEIDYEKVDLLIKEKREYSLEFLRTALK